MLEPHVDERISKSAPFRQPFHFRNPAGRGREEYLVYTPAGIEHPVHLAVHKWISADFRYLDIPYNKGLFVYATTNPQGTKVEDVVYKSNRQAVYI